MHGCPRNRTECHPCSAARPGGGRQLQFLLPGFGAAGAPPLRPGSGHRDGAVPAPAGRRPGPPILLLRNSSVCSRCCCWTSAGGSRESPGSLWGQRRWQGRHCARGEGGRRSAVSRVRGGRVGGRRGSVGVARQAAPQRQRRRRRRRRERSEQRNQRRRRRGVFCIVIGKEVLRRQCGPAAPAAIAAAAGDDDAECGAAAAVAGRRVVPVDVGRARCWPAAAAAVAGRGAEDGKTGHGLSTGGIVRCLPSNAATPTADTARRKPPRPQRAAAAAHGGAGKRWWVRPCRRRRWRERRC